MASKRTKLAYSTDSQAGNDSRAEKNEKRRPPGAAFAVQGNQPVRVWLERKGRGGKVVSVIKGVVGPKANKQALLKQLKSKLGTGGAVKGEDLEIQGDHRDRIVALLQELGYPAKKAGG